MAFPYEVDPSSGDSQTEGFNKQLKEFANQNKKGKKLKKNKMI